MNRTILYYPTINIPRHTWLRHALLYWDEVSSIVPRSWDNRMLSELSPDIHYLIDEGQFRPMQPEDLIFNRNNWDVLDQFREEFKAIISSNAFRAIIKVKNNSDYRIHINKIENRELSRIHYNKISDGLLQILEEEGLARRNEENPDWLMFEKNTALLYMSLLAKHLADIDGDQTSIGTDLSEYERFNFKRVNQNAGFPVISFSLSNVLPTPNINVPFEKIVDFKRKRADNLLHFKRMISDFQIKISKSKSQTELKEAAITFRESIMTGVKDLSAVLKDSRIESRLKTFKSLINLKSPTLIASAGALINNRFNFINLPFELEAVGLTVIGAIELTCNFIEARNKERAKLRESSFSYIYQAQRLGIIRDFR